MPTADVFHSPRELVEILGPGFQPGAVQIPAQRIGHRLGDGHGQLLAQRVDVLAPGHLFAIGRLHGEGHPQVIRDLAQVERVDGHQNAAAPAQFALDLVEQ